MSLGIAFTLFIVGILLSRLLKNRTQRETFQLALNVGLLYWIFFRESLVGSSLLILIVIIHFICMNRRVLNIGIPLLTICLFRFFPSNSLIGVSFVCFRLISAAMEVSNGEVRKPNLREYLFYVFYFPTFKLGPIGRLKDHIHSPEGDLQWIQLARVLYGVVKFTFSAALVSNFHQSLEIKNILLKGAFLYLTMYLTFSGFNDIAIGVSHFLGFRMKENFNHPILARNVGDFWSRWHISLTDILKEMIFYPMNLALIRRFGKNSKYFVTPLSFLVLFLAIGLWHGFTVNFVVLGLYYAVGAIIAYYFSLLKIKETKLTRVLSIILTQIFIAISFTIFHSKITDLHL